MRCAPRLKDISHIDFLRKSDFSQETPFRVLKHGGYITTEQDLFTTFSITAMENSPLQLFPL